MKKTIILILIIFVSGCKKNNSEKSIDIEKEISELITNSEKTEYLEKIFRTDQEIRDGKDSELVLKYGNESQEMLDFYSKMDSIDRLNLKRIQFYLNEFGYPRLDSTTTEGNMAPWLVIHHSMDLNKRKDFFPILKKAYRDGDVNLNQFEMYLGRTYQLEFGNYPSSEGGYDSNEKIARLIHELKLE